MALDEALAREAALPVLRFYAWAVPSVSIGCFQDVDEVDLQYVSDGGMQLVRRITGGRGILHGHELTYSFSAPIEGVFGGGLRQTYTLLGDAFSRAFRSLGLEPETAGLERARARVRGRSPICFESASLGEIKLGGKKVVGSAQKRWPGRFMQQGSVPFDLDFQALARVFRSEGRERAGRCMAGVRDVMPSLGSDELKKALASAFEEVFGITFNMSEPTEREETLARELEIKYRSPEWTMKRQRQSMGASAGRGV